ncbi:MAG: hypothetical protein ACREGB_00565, partial [Candidatus Saccharimonadales bacterium]
KQGNAVPTGPGSMTTVSHKPSGKTSTLAVMASEDKKISKDGDGTSDAGGQILACEDGKMKKDQYGTTPAAGASGASGTTPPPAAPAGPNSAAQQAQDSMRRAFGSMAPLGKEELDKKNIAEAPGGAAIPKPGMAAKPPNPAVAPSKNPAAAAAKQSMAGAKPPAPAGAKAPAMPKVAAPKMAGPKVPMTKGDYFRGKLDKTRMDKGGEWKDSSRLKGVHAPVYEKNPGMSHAGAGVRRQDSPDEHTSEQKPKPLHTKVLEEIKDMKGQNRSGMGKSEALYLIEGREIYKNCMHCGQPEFTKSEDGHPQFKPCICFLQPGDSDRTEFLDVIEKTDAGYVIKFDANADADSVKAFLLTLKTKLLLKKRFGV